MCIQCAINVSRLPPEPTRIKSWYHSKFQLILAIFGPLILKLCSDISESGGNAGFSLADFQHLEDSQPMRKQDSFSPTL